MNPHRRLKLEIALARELYNEGVYSEKEYRFLLKTFNEELLDLRNKRNASKLNRTFKKNFGLNSDEKEK